MELALTRTRAAKRDPRPRWEKEADATQASRLRHISEADAAAILAPRLDTLDVELSRIYETENFDKAQAALELFDQGLSRDAQQYFERARKAAGDGVDELVGVLNQYAWNGIAIDSIRALLQPGEKLARVELRYIETNKGRRLGRSEIQEAAKPSTHTNGRWSENFISEANLRELEAAAAEREGNAARPPHWDSCNRDLPRGIS